MLSRHWMLHNSYYYTNTSQMFRLQPVKRAVNLECSNLLAAGIPGAAYSCLI